MKRAKKPAPMAAPKPQVTPASSAGDSDAIDLGTVRALATVLDEFGLSELRWSAGAQKIAAHGIRCQRNNIRRRLQKPKVTIAQAHHFPTAPYGGSGGSTNDGVKPGAIAAAGENADFAWCFSGHTRNFHM